MSKMICQHRGGNKGVPRERIFNNSYRKVLQGIGNQMIFF